jgi:hypothetical protein
LIHLQTVDLPLDLARAPRGVDGGGNGGDVFFEVISETNDRAELPTLGSGNPLPQLSGLVGHRRVPEAKRYAPQVNHLRALPRDAIQQLPLSVGHLVGAAGDHDGVLGPLNWEDVREQGGPGDSASGWTVLVAEANIAVAVNGAH